MADPNFNPHRGKQFSKDYQPANKGPKKKIFKWIKEKYELGQPDLENIINYISMMSQEQYLDMIDKIKRKDDSVKDMPMLVLKIMQAYAKANVDDIIKLMRATGKATEKHEITGKDGSELFNAFKKNLMGD